MAVKPIKRGVITSDFGERILNGKREFHTGVDIGVVGSPDNIPVYCAKPGKIAYINNDLSKGKQSGGGFGRVVYIQLYDGWYAIYPHLSLINGDLRVGDQILEGAFVGIMGDTGYSFGRHIHYQERKTLGVGGESRCPDDIIALYE